jgi:PhoD-like phosphatase
MADLLLAGPILRRVTLSRVCVWFATERKMSFKLTIQNGSQAIGVSDITKIDTERCQLGGNLFVYLLVAQPIANEGVFPFDELLSYRIDQISENTEKAINLKALKLTYGNNEFPTFFIPKQLERLLHGSCRKPHGHVVQNEPNFDALSRGDTEIADHHADVITRPALLLLTGDQIYADDVADSILALLKQKGPLLLGYQEMLPLKDGGTFDPSISQPDGRKALADDEAGFSSDQANNHLFTFGEFAAMYIYVLGNAVDWTPDFTLETDADLRQALQDFHKTLPNVRRLLANIPTYMIFDDHDVTDDWNITGAWYDTVRSLPLGRRVIANALAGYWAFQGWGNEPENFDWPMVHSTIDYLATNNPSNNLAEQYELNTWKHRGWGYSVPTNPPIIVMDSRTQRQPDGAYYPPQLMDRYALDWLRMEWITLMVKKEHDIKMGHINDLPLWPIIVATTPVMGFAPVDGVQQLALWAVGAIEDSLIIRLIEKQLQARGLGTSYLANVLDAEGWICNRDGFGNFMNCVLHRMDIQQCVFLSGDVHYSFTARAHFDNMGKTLHCFQLTSSALCNTPSDNGKLIGQVGQAKGESGHNNWWAYNPEQRWETKTQYIPEDGTINQRITSQCNIGLVEFNEAGQPIKHTLLNNAASKVFTLLSS